MAHFLINSGRGVKQSLHTFRQGAFQLKAPCRSYTGSIVLNWGQVLLEWRGQTVFRQGL
jgi:hypothetical protein